MRRRDFNSGLLLAGKSIQPLLAQAPTKQRRLAIVAAAGKPENISGLDHVFWHAFFLELPHLGHFEGGDLIVGRYSAEGHPGRYDDLAREVVSLNQGYHSRDGQPARTARRGKLPDRRAFLLLGLNR